MIVKRFLFFQKCTTLMPDSMRNVGTGFTRNVDQTDYESGMTSFYRAD